LQKKIALFFHLLIGITNTGKGFKIGYSILKPFLIYKNNKLHSGIIGAWAIACRDGDVQQAQINAKLRTMMGSLAVGMTYGFKFSHRLE
jgi:hypothetical protein